MWLMNWFSALKTYWVSQLCAVSGEYLMRYRTFVIALGILAAAVRL